MKQSFLKLMNDYLLQVIGTVSGIDFYDEVVKDIELQKESSVVPIYNELKKQMDDTEYRGKLSPIEQQVLGKNLLNYQRMIRDMDDALSTLMKSKWSNNVRGALWMLEDARLFINYLLTNTDEDGTLLKAKDLSNTKKYLKMDYIGKISHCQTMLHIITDILNEGDIGDFARFTLKANLGKAAVMLQYEIEDREANGSPELYKFEIPKLEEPELPESAEPVEAEEVKIPVEAE